jgi:hypothetical protein
MSMEKDEPMGSRQAGRQQRDFPHANDEACIIENRLARCDDPGSRHQLDRLRKLKELTGWRPGRPLPLYGFD